MRKNITTSLLLILLILGACIPKEAVQPVKTAEFSPASTALSRTVTGAPPIKIKTNTALPPYETSTPISLADETLCIYENLVLPDSEATGLNEDEIARKLIERWLIFYKDPKRPDRCRIEDFNITEISKDPSYLYEHLMPQGDFMRTVAYSIKYVQLQNIWVGSGKLIEKKHLIYTVKDMAIFHSDSGYTFKFAYP
jgi:hypothetical protein